MKRVILVLAGLSILVFAQAQKKASKHIFEGQVTYEIDYQIGETEELTIEQLKHIWGTEEFFYIKGGNYKMVQNGVFIKEQLYRVDENKCYSLTGESDTWYWTDFSRKVDDIVRYKLQKKQATILGVICDLLIIEGKKSTGYFYFNKKYKVNPDLYNGHKSGFWYYMLSKTKAIPLKTIIESPKVTIIRTAKEVKKMKLKNTFFELPEGVDTAPSIFEEK